MLYSRLTCSWVMLYRVFFGYITQIFYDIPRKRCDKATINGDMATTMCDLGVLYSKGVIFLET